jgi:hypothetical protein
MLLSFSRAAAAQAWAPPAGTGSVSVVFQRIDNTSHLLTDGSRIQSGMSLDVSVYVEAEYAMTDRLSVSVGLPYILAKYVDPLPPPPHVPYLPVDQCHCWQHGWQDFGFTARYNVVNGAFALTPSVSVGVPSHDYNFQGEAVVGRDLKEIRLAVDAGQRLDWISPKLSVQGRYAYAVVERVLAIPNNRSNATVEGAVRVTRKLSARGSFSWQRTHGGLRFGSLPGSALPAPADVDTVEKLAQHDRLLRDNYVHAGTSVAYALPGVDMFASYVGYVSGTDSHAGHVVTVGMSWPFEWHRGSTP